MTPERLDASFLASTGTFTDSFSIVPAGSNQPPNVRVGPDLAVVRPNLAVLSGTVTDDGLPVPPGATSASWSMASGPGTEVAVANLALSRAGVTMDLTRRLAARLPEGPGEALVRLGCDVHPWMRGWLVVIEHGLAAVTDAAGSYAIRDVPAGAYTLSVWHEVLGRRERPVTVPGTGTMTLDEQF